MPLARYFLFVGAALLTLLFAVDAYMPEMPPAERTNAAANLSVIRIHSDRKWPERVVFDTSLPTITPVPVESTEANAAALTGVADLPTKVAVREALAQLPASSPGQLQPVDARKLKPQRKRKTVARGYMGPPTMLVAQQPRLGFFGNTIW